MFDDMTLEHKTALKPFSPHVRFEIPSEKTDWQYRVYVSTLILEALTNADARNHDRCFTLAENSGEEG